MRVKFLNADNNQHDNGEFQNTNHCSTGSLYEVLCETRATADENTKAKLQNQKNSNTCTKWIILKTAKSPHIDFTKSISRNFSDFRLPIHFKNIQREAFEDKISYRIIPVLVGIIFLLTIAPLYILNEKIVQNIEAL